MQIIKNEHFTISGGDFRVIMGYSYNGSGNNFFFNLVERKFAKDFVEEKVWFTFVYSVVRIQLMATVYNLQTPFRKNHIFTYRITTNIASIY